MTCPLCGRRKARRACPALGHQICAVCCGTKRLTEIQCPSDCIYLTSSREHPPAVVVRQQQHDIGWLVHAMRDFNDRQSRLFVLICTFLTRYQPDELQTLADVDVVEAAGALASTFETAVRGVIYEHRAESIPAERLAAALRPALAEAGKNGGTSFDRDAAVVLRRLSDAARELQRESDGARRALLDLLDRTLRRMPPENDAESPPGEAPRLIVP
jgi:hypothetical protein